MREIETAFAFEVSREDMTRSLLRMACAVMVKGIHTGEVTKESAIELLRWFVRECFIDMDAPIVMHDEVADEIARSVGRCIAAEHVKHNPTPSQRALVLGQVFASALMEAAGLTVRDLEKAREEQKQQDSETSSDA